MPEIKIEQKEWDEFETWCHTQWTCLPTGKMLIEYWLNWKEIKQVTQEGK